MVKNICVYCSSGDNIDKKYFAIAKELGEKIAQNNLGLVYGGSSLGLMGEVSNTAHQCGAKVLGVVPEKIFNSKIAEDPLDTITKKEYYKIVGNKIDENLSDFEKKVLTRFAAGESYVKIAERLDSPVKSIDNAIQRIRKKASKNIMNED